jgi:hypothetical protein
MAFTYVPATGATRDLLRFAIGDTDDSNSDKQIFTDAELDMMIGEYGSDINTLAGRCMLAVASSASRIAVMCAIGSRDFVIDRKKVAEECREQAREFFKQAKETLSATEVALEDEDMTWLDSLGNDAYGNETELTELND